MNRLAEDASAFAAPPHRAASADAHSPLLRRLAPALVALAAVVPYLPSLHNDFVNWDDNYYLVENRDYRGLSFSHLRWMATTMHEGHWQPLSWLTWGIDYCIWETWAGGYHLTNIVLHAVGALVFYSLARRLIALSLADRAASRGIVRVPDDHALTAGALLAAVLFAAHPLRVESVVWATERRDVLSGIFYFLTLLLYLRWWQRRADTGAPRGFPFAAFAAFLLALLSKSMSVSLPVIMLLLDIYPLRRIGPAAGGWLSRRSLRAALEKAPFALLSLAGAAVAFHAANRIGAVGSMSRYSVADRLAIWAYNQLFYLRKTLWPFDLSPLYEMPLQMDPLFWHWTGSGLLILLFTIWSWRRRRAAPGLLAAWLIYTIMLLPTSGLVHAGPQLVADRYSYLPCTVPAVVLGALLAAQLAARSRARIALPRAPRTAPLGLITLLALALGALSWRQSLVWRNSHALWTHVLRLEPENWHALNNLGIWYAERDEPVEAIRLYRECLRVKPGYANALSNMGLALEKIGEYDAAAEAYRETIQHEPEYVHAYVHLAGIYYRRQRYDDALAQYHQALRYPHKIRGDVGLAQILANLGQTLTALGRTDEAIDNLRRAAQLDPQLPEAQFNLGVALEARGDFATAADAYRAALALRADYVSALNNLGVVLVRLQRHDEAVATYRALLALEPDRLKTLFNLGNLLWMLGRDDEVLAVLTRAHDLQPDHVASASRLALLLATSPRDDLRDGRRALDLAEYVRRATADSPQALDLLAAAHAELGDFAAAQQFAADAVAKAEARGRADWAAEFSDHLRLYQQNRPRRTTDRAAPTAETTP